MDTEELIDAIEHYRDRYVNELSPMHVTLLNTLLDLARDIADVLDWSVQNKPDFSFTHATDSKEIRNQHHALPAPEEEGTPAPLQTPTDREWQTGSALEHLEHLFFDADLSNYDMNTLVSYRTRLQHIIQVIDDTIDEPGYYI